MNGIEQFASKIDTLERELTALKTSSIKSSGVISTEKKYLTINIPLDQYGSGERFITLTPINSDVMLSQIYSKNISDEIHIIRLAWNRYSVVKSDYNMANTTYGANIVVVATDDFNYSVGE